MGNTSKKSNVILTDFKPNEKWDFLTILNEISGQEWDVEYKKTNNLHGHRFANLYRLLLYFIFPLKILLKSNRYNKIIGWQQFYGLNIAFFSRLFHLKKKNELYVMTFIYKKKKGGGGFLYHKYMNYIVTSKYIDKFICFSKNEIDYYNSVFNIDKSKFVFIPLGLKPINDISVCDDGYIFATGRSNRNYDFLINLFDKSPYNIVIACDSYKNDTANGSNVKILTHCHGKSMLDLMAKCHVVVIPLKDVNISSGQLVVLQAMALGKPVICTDSNGIKDYVLNEITGLLVNNNKDEWENAIEKLYMNKTFYNNLVVNSKLIFNKKYTEKNMFKNIASLVK